MRQQRPSWTRKHRRIQYQQTPAGATHTRGSNHAQGIKPSLPEVAAHTLVWKHSRRAAGRDSLLDRQQHRPEAHSVQVRLVHFVGE
eukprot:365077-Chlamydomonas_euryale.AAC.5